MHVMNIFPVPGGICPGTFCGFCGKQIEKDDKDTGIYRKIQWGKMFTKAGFRGTILWYDTEKMGILGIPKMKGGGQAA
ncbi:MAG: hypothetical protein ACI3V0_09495 [Faecousia sp.]